MSDIPELEQHIVGFFRRGPSGPTDEAILEENQRKHLAYLSQLHQAGQLLAYGPVDSPDPSLRGLLIFGTRDVEEAASLLDRDPHVMSGRLIYDFVTWYTGKGTISFAKYAAPDQSS